MADILDNLQKQIENIKEFMSMHGSEDVTTGYSDHNDRIFRIELSVNPFAGVVNIVVTATDTMKSEGVSESFSAQPISVSRLMEIESILVKYIEIQEVGKASKTDFQ